MEQKLQLKKEQEQRVARRTKLKISEEKAKQSMEEDKKVEEIFTEHEVKANRTYHAYKNLEEHKKPDPKTLRKMEFLHYTPERLARAIEEETQKFTPQQLEEFEMAQLQPQNQWAKMGYIDRPRRRPRGDEDDEIDVEYKKIANEPESLPKLKAYDGGPRSELPKLPGGRLVPPEDYSEEEEDQDDEDDDVDFDAPPPPLPPAAGYKPTS